MNCPHCSGRDVGRIAPDHFYCWDCCVEFERRQDGWEIFAVDDEGQLVPLADAAPVDPSPGGVAAVGP